VRFRIHNALFAGFLGVIVVFILLMGALVGNRVRTDLTDAFEAELGRQLNLTASIIRQAPPITWDSVVTAVGREVGHRVTIIAVDGEVMADSDVATDSLDILENHAGRPEVVGAMEGFRSFAQRTSATVNEPLLYGAQRIELSDGTVVLRMAAPLTRVEAAVDRLRGRVVLTGILVSFIALLVAWALSVALAWPMASLADQARQLAGGDLEQRVTTGRRVVEMENLAQAFNRLAADLQSRMHELSGERDEIQAIIDSLDEGVLALDPEARVVRWNRAATELLNFPAELDRRMSVASLVRHPALKAFLMDTARGIRSRSEVKANERDLVLVSQPLAGGGGVAGILDVSEIRRLEQVRRDFVANASHELKTPLTSIRGFAETLVDDDPEPELRRAFLSSILKNTVRLQNMVDDLLDLSRLESGGWVAQAQKVDLADLAEEAFESMEDKFGGRSFEVRGKGKGLGDPAGLIQVFRNLYENAIRHTDDEGAITVQVRKELDVIHVAVNDDGEGIPQVSLPRIFERFYRADSSRARDQGGTGLGLAIVRHLLSSMGGNVWAESELGRGTSINFTLPRPDRRADPRTALPPRARVLEAEEPPREPAPTAGGRTRGASRGRPAPGPDGGVAVSRTGGDE
jgi:two-component system phosphate regulon sensor histidine kinase PhoR